jgi:hypothetical protein
MIPLQMALSALCALVAVWLVVLIVRDRTPDNLALNTLGVIEVGLVANLVIGVVRVTGDVPTGVSVWEYIGYLVGVLLFIPVGLVWSAGERTRGGTGVLLVALLLVPFMFVRLAYIWAGNG